MRYVVAGYGIVLAILFFYAVGLAWRRRKFTRLVAAADAPAPAPTAAGTPASIPAGDSA